MEEAEVLVKGREIRIAMDVRREGDVFSVEENNGGLWVNGRDARD